MRIVAQVQLPSTLSVHCYEFVTRLSAGGHFLAGCLRDSRPEAELQPQRRALADLDEVQTKQRAYLEFTTDGPAP
jgi:hypothetical protein